jgi:hypothetical protein
MTRPGDELSRARIPVSSSFALETSKAGLEVKFQTGAGQMIGREGRGVEKSVNILDFVTAINPGIRAASTSWRRRRRNSLLGIRRTSERRD